MILIFPAAILVLLFAFFVAATLHLKSRLVYLIAVFLLAYANIVISIEISSLFHQITPVFVLFIHLVLSGIAWLVWSKAGKPALFGPYQDRLFIWKELPPIRRYPLIYAYGFLVGIAYLVGAVLILTTPQNNFDSMTYHLSRVGYWLQHQSLYPWLTHNLRQTTLQMNAEIGVLWTVLFWGTDQLSGFVQWFGVWITAAAVYGIARILGATRWQGILVSLLMLTYPEVYLQSITTMNDLITAAFISSAVLLLFLGWHSGQKAHLWISALGFSLAVGTKITAALTAPSLFIILIILGITYPRNLRSKVLNFLVVGIICFALVGSYSYVQNLLYYQNPMPMTGTISAEAGSRTRWQLMFEGLSLHTIQAIDLTGIPPALQEPLGSVKAKIFKPLINDLSVFQDPQWSKWRFGLNLILNNSTIAHEDISWFGLLFLFLFIPAAIGQFVHSIRHKDIFSLSLLILVIGFSISLSFLIRWSWFQGRYYVLIIPFATALMYPWFSGTRNLAWVHWIIAFISVVILYQTIIYNYAKPFLGSRAIWGKESISIRANTKVNIEPVLAAFQAYLPEDGRVAVCIGPDSWDYPLFGQRFQRYVISLGSPSKYTDLDWLREQEIKYLLVESKRCKNLTVPDDMERVWQSAGWILYGFCGPAPCLPDPETPKAVLKLTEYEKLVSISPQLAGDVKIEEMTTASWGIEQVDKEEVLWLGEGPSEGFELVLQSDTLQKVKIVLHGIAGPARPDLQRTLRVQVVHQGENNKSSKEGGILDKSFLNSARLQYLVELQPGLNQIRMYSTDTATVRQQADGDMRPMLILIHGIEIRGVE